MFWNSEFMDDEPSHINVVLQMQTVKLSDILFEEDLLHELKTSNLNLDNFLARPDVIAELVDNITQLTEKDCCDKLLYSNVHAAYISCEILTYGPSEIYTAFMNHPESLSKIISCLTTRPKQQDRHQRAKLEQPDHQQTQQQHQQQQQQSHNENEVENENETKTGTEIEIEIETEIETVPETEPESEPKPESESESESEPQPQPQPQPQPKTETETETSTEDENSIEAAVKTDSEVEIKSEIKLENQNETENEVEAETTQRQLDDIKPNDTSLDQSQDCSPEIVYMTKVVPQKATLVSKLLGSIHSLAAAKLSCHITQDINSFSRLINLLVQNIDISGAFEILCTFIKRTEPPELRYVFCELLSNLKFVQKLIDVMTLSDIEDKQRNACQLLCDIIVIGRQDASEQTSGPKAQDMLSELLESNEAAHVMLEQMFSENMRNTTAIVCGIKVLQTLLDNKLATDQQNVQQQNGTIEKIQEEIENYLMKFHELLLNPPKQQPIKTTFGIIQKPLGYLRLEVVNLIRALISTNSSNIIKKLVELKTMKVIIDLFVQYSWNNLLHTQVEQALCLIINNCRKGEEEFTMGELSIVCDHFFKHQGEVWKQSQIDNELVANNVSVVSDQQQTQESKEEEQQPQQVMGEQVEEIVENGELKMQEPSRKEHQPQEEPESQTKLETTEQMERPEKSGEAKQSEHLEQPEQQEQSEQLKESERLQLQEPQQHSNSIISQQHYPPDQESPQMIKERSVTEIPSVALLSQLLNECDLIGKLLLPRPTKKEVYLDYQGRYDGEKANFGHIIQMINSIAINRDLDTIRKHLNYLKEERMVLYDRWTTFVNVDVASFKEISLYYDTQSATNNIDNRYSQTRHSGQIPNNRFAITPNVHTLGSQSDNGKSPNNNADEQFLAYVAFAREVVLPSINIDVLPTPREMYKTIQNH